MCTYSQFTLWPKKFSSSASNICSSQFTHSSSDTENCMPINRTPVDTSANSAASHAQQCNFLRIEIWAQAHRRNWAGCWGCSYWGADWKNWNYFGPGTVVRAEDMKEEGWYHKGWFFSSVVASRVIMCRSIAFLWQTGKCFSGIRVIGSISRI